MRAKLVYVWNLAEEVAMFGLKFVVKKSVKNHPEKGKHNQSKRKGPLHKKLRIYSVNMT